MATTFRMDGHRVMTAFNGKDAVDQLRDGHLPAVIVLDLMMPVLDGLRFLELARADQRLGALPVIVVTSGDAELPFGAQAIIRKPADMDVLLSMVGARCAHAETRGPAYPAG